MPAAPQTDRPDLPPAPAGANKPPAGADDLLAQLAGDEIDRLLAEADKHAATGGAATTVPEGAAGTLAPEPGVTDAPDDPDHAAVVAAAADVATAEASAVAAGLPKSSAHTFLNKRPPARPRSPGEALHPDDPLAGQLDTLFAELTKTDSADAPAPAPANSDTPTPAAPPSPSSATDPSESQDSTSPAERAALAALAAALEEQPPDAAASPSLTDHPLTHPTDTTDTTDRSDTTDPSDPATEADKFSAAIDAVLAPAAPPQSHARRPLPSFVLKPLVWINAPFAFLPDTLRDILGKAGLVTLVNALVLLAYLRFVRKH